MNESKARILSAIIPAIATLAASCITFYGMWLQLSKESSAEIADLNAKIASLQSENSELKATISELRLENDLIANQIKELERTISLSSDETRADSGSESNDDNENNERPKPRMLLTACPPYESHNYFSLETVTMADTTYGKSFYLHRHGSSDLGWALFNLRGGYSTLTFDVGHMDGAAMKSGTYDFFLDGELIKTITLHPEMLPEHYEIDLTESVQMKIVGSVGYPEAYALTNIYIQ